MWALGLLTWGIATVTHMTAEEVTIIRKATGHQHAEAQSAKFYDNMKNTTTMKNFHDIMSINGIGTRVEEGGSSEE